MAAKAQLQRGEPRLGLGAACAAVHRRSGFLGLLLVVLTSGRMGISQNRGTPFIPQTE